MNIARLTSCTNCNSLKEVYNSIQCTILDMMRKRWASAQFNTSLNFDQPLFDDLVRYKRVVGKRIYNSSYPCTSVDVQDIITQAKLRAYISGDCSACADCCPEEPTTTSTTTTTTSSTTLS